MNAGDGSARPSVGFIGLGRMGRPMAANVAAAGFPLRVYNRTASKAEAFAAATPGVEVCRTPAVLAADSDVVVAMLADGEAAEEVYLGPDGLVEALRPGSLVVDMGTIGPDRVADLSERFAAVGAALVDAPVSGSVSLAQEGRITVMAAGGERDVERARPILEAIGDPVLYVGPSGSGAVMKLAVNTIVYGLNQSVSEALVLAERAGLDRLLTYSVFANSAIAAPFVHYRRDSFERPEASPVYFRVALASKDLRLALDLAGAVGAELPQAETNLRLLEETEAAGLVDEDVSAVARYLRARGAKRAPPEAVASRGGDHISAGLATQDDRGETS